MSDLVDCLVPYPRVYPDGRFEDGIMLSQPEICIRCKPKDCVEIAKGNAATVVQFSQCSKGMSLITLPFKGKNIVCNGIIVKGHASSCPKEIRKRFETHRVHPDEILRWHKKISEASTFVESKAGDNIVAAVQSLHDVSTGVSLVMRNAEAIISSLPGYSDDERIENASPELKSLLKSVQLMYRRLLMPSLLTNPQAAAHGQKRNTPIYRLFHRMVRLFEQPAGRRRIQLRMRGASINTPMCYDSLETIALVLIDNAVKYSETDRDVFVTVNDLGARFVHVEVESYGPSVPADLRMAIFGKGVRAPAATSFASTGSGLGLYIAGIVARAHGFKIDYNSIGSDATGRATNVFSFTISS